MAFLKGSSLRLWPVLALAGLVLVAPGTGRSAEGSNATVEARVKAAFLLSFAAFVDWPAHAFGSDAEPVRIAILGDDPFGDDLEQLLHRERVQGRRFEIRRVTSPLALPDCHLLYIASSEARHVARTLAALEGRPTLTVSSLPRFVEQGGMIQFVTQRGRIRFRINAEEAGAAGLTLSSKLLRLSEPN